MTRARSTHSGFRIASTFVISREKNSYAYVVHTCVIHTTLTWFPALLYNQLSESAASRHLFNVDVCDGLQVHISDLVLLSFGHG